MAKKERQVKDEVRERAERVGNMLEEKKERELAALRGGRAYRRDSGNQPKEYFSGRTPPNQGNV